MVEKALGASLHSLQRPCAAVGLAPGQGMLSQHLRAVPLGQINQNHDGQERLRFRETSSAAGASPWSYEEGDDEPPQLHACPAREQEGQWLDMAIKN